MNFKVMPRGFKQSIAIAGLLLALPGFFMGLGLLCLALVLIINNDTDSIYAGLIGFSLLLVTAGTGGTIFWHGIASLNGKTSKPLRLPPLSGLIGIFVLYFVIGLIIYQSDFVTGLLLPPVLLVVASVPSLIAILWFTNQQLDGLTWRRGIISFAGAATLSLIIFIVLQFAILIIASMFNPDPLREMIDILEVVIAGLFERNGMSGMLNQHSSYVFIQFTIIIPLIGTLAKPLITLPLLGQLSRREAFLIGAVAGAGFAMMENLIYLDLELQSWFGIIIVQAFGSAIHPLGSGLVAMGLWEMVRGKPNAWFNWLAFSGIAVALHSLWNLGFLLVVSWYGLFMFGGLAFTSFRMEGLVVVALIGLAVGTLLAGRAVGQKVSHTFGTSEGESVVNQRTLIDRGLAIWALASLIVIIPVGLVGLQNLLR